MSQHRRVVAWLTGAAAFAAAIAALVVGAASAAAPSKGTVIATTKGAFGTMLVVGSGKYAGYTLYMITSDRPGSFGCTTKVQSILGHPGSCTGKSGDTKAEWPAITTVGAPIAGPGVSQKLLGVVARPGVGDQVTYAGHPLYLFDMGPGQITGEEWDEPSLPPWHGVWFVISPTGSPLAWPGTLTTTTVDGKTVLAALMLTGAGWFPFPVYSYSKDTATKSTCIGSCAISWPPLLSAGRPGLRSGVAGSKVAEIMRADGTDQIAYGGKPLYLDANEQIKPTATGFAALGNGNGQKAAGGTFALVAP